MGIMKTILLTLAFILSPFNISAQDGIKRPDSYNYMRGLEAMQNEEYGNAIKYFNKDIQDNPKNGYAFYCISYIRYLHDEYGRALTAADKAIQNLSKKDKTWMSATLQIRAKIYLALEDTAKAITDYTAAIKLDKENTALLNERGQIYYELRDLTHSDDDYRKIIKIQPGNPLGYIGLGRNFDFQGLYEEAINQYNQAIKMNADDPQPYTFRAETFWNLKKYREGADDIVKAFNIEISNQNIGRAWYTFLRSPIEAIPDIIIKLKVQAEIYPNKADVWNYYTGIAYENSNDFSNAVKFYIRSFEKQPDDVKANRISSCYNELGHYANAMEYIDKAISLDSTEHEYLINKANIEYNAGKTDDAINDISDYIRLNPDYFGYYNRGWFKENNGDIDGAITDYNMSVAIQPEVFVLTNLGRLYMIKGQNEKATELLQQALLIDTVANDESYAHYALFYLGKEEEAKAWMEKILNIDQSAGTYYNAACLYSLTDEKEKSLNFLRTALEKGFRRFCHIRNDRDLNNIRILPEFNILLEEYENKLKAEIKQISNQGISNYTEKIEEVPFIKNGTTYKIRCSINGLPLFFIFDTGASDVSLSSVEASFMIKNGYIKPQDIIGKQNYLTASGDIVEGTIINLKEVSLGKLSLKDVRASVQSNQNAPLLLGQSVLNRLGKIEIDHNRMMLKITYKEKANPVSSYATGRSDEEKKTYNNEIQKSKYSQSK